jgi:molybdopterin/thiamine biosynthesis adenylyltransferase
VAPRQRERDLETSRHDRQARFARIGVEGQRRLAGARVLVLGCGALGAAAAELLARAGVGRLTLVDRDFVDWTNLQRQGLYDEEDARLARPKAVAAARRLRAIDSGIALEPVVVDAQARSLPGLLAGHDLAIDGADNFATRHLLNEACVREGIPWIYGACVGSYGCSAPLVPHDGPCLRCLQDQLPAAGETPTCDTVGVIGPAVEMVAAWQAAEALKLLVGDRAALRRELWSCDLWTGSFQRLRLAGWRDPACAVCGPAPTFPALSTPDDAAVTLCGRDAVQVRRATPDLAALTRSLAGAVLASNEYLVRWRDGERLGTCFRDGRVIVQGVHDAAAARAFCDRWLG